jgi:DNA-binding protein H-NS
MARINISSMNVENLLALRDQIDAKLGEHRQSLHKELARLGLDEAPRARGGNGQSSLKGRKVAPKYRSKKDPKLTWAGRGATPLWMRDEMKARKLKKEAFLIK